MRSLPNPPKNTSGAGGSVPIVRASPRRPRTTRRPGIRPSASPRSQPLQRALHQRTSLFRCSGLQLAADGTVGLALGVAEGEEGLDRGITGAGGCRTRGDSEVGESVVELDDHLLRLLLPDP